MPKHVEKGKVMTKGAKGKVTVVPFSKFFEPVVRPVKAIRKTPAKGGRKR